MRSDGTQTTAVVSPTFQSCRALGMDAFPKLWGLRGLKGALGGSAGGGTAAFPGLVSKTTNYLRTDIQKQLLACSDCLKERKQQQQRQKKGKKPTMLPNILQHFIYELQMSEQTAAMCWVPSPVLTQGATSPYNHFSPCKALSEHSAFSFFGSSLRPKLSWKPSQQKPKRD